MGLQRAVGPSERQQSRHVLHERLLRLEGLLFAGFRDQDASTLQSDGEFSFVGRILRCQRQSMQNLIHNINLRNNLQILLVLHFQYSQESFL